MAKLSLRLVPDRDLYEICDALKAQLESLLLPGI
ncbi:MAG: hypothetical protein IIA55_09540 [Gemmatimonadetes bacterium]|nr:hypothetical protein [Gemmatimonadota bacterium]